MWPDAKAMSKIHNLRYLNLGPARPRTYPRCGIRAFKLEAEEQSIMHLKSILSSIINEVRQFISRAEEQ